MFTSTEFFWGVGARDCDLKVMEEIDYEELVNFLKELLNDLIRSFGIEVCEKGKNEAHAEKMEKTTEEEKKTEGNEDEKGKNIDNETLFNDYAGEYNEINNDSTGIYSDKSKNDNKNDYVLIVGNDFEMYMVIKDLGKIRHIQRIELRRRKRVRGKRVFWGYL